MPWDGELHGRLRRLQNKVFTPNMVDRMRLAMREVAMRLAGRFAGEGVCDFFADFSTRYPVEIIARILGIPTDELSQFDRWSTDLALVFCFPIEPVRDRVERAIAGLFAYLGELVERRRRRPGDDVISELIAVSDGGDRLSAEELRWQLVNLTFAGHDTTRNQLAHPAGLLRPSRPVEASRRRPAPGRERGEGGGFASMGVFS